MPDPDKPRRMDLRSTATYRRARSRYVAAHAEFIRKQAYLGGVQMRPEVSLADLKKAGDECAEVSVVVDNFVGELQRLEAKFGGSYQDPIVNENDEIDEVASDGARAK